MQKFNPSSMGVTAKLVKKALGAHSFLPDNYENERAQSAPVQVQHRVRSVISGILVQIYANFFHLIQWFFFHGSALSLSLSLLPSSPPFLFCFILF